MFSENPNLKYKLLWLAIGYALVSYIIYSSLTPDPIEFDVDFGDVDKYGHFTSYFVLMGWFMQIYHTKKMVIVCTVALVSLGVALEFIQEMTGYRYFDIYDMLANSLGILLALLLIKTPFPKILHYIELKSGVR